MSQTTRCDRQPGQRLERFCRANAASNILMRVFRHRAMGVVCTGLLGLLVAGCHSPFAGFRDPCTGGFVWPAIPVDWPWKKPQPLPDTDYLQACSQLSYFVSDRFWQRPPQRVVIICPEGANIPSQLRKATVENVAAQLRQERLFEVIVDNEDHRCRCDWEAIRNGRFDEYRLLELTDKFQCDAVMIIGIHQFDANWPMNAAVTCALIDREEAVVLMAADGQWDLRDTQRQRIYESYLKKFAAIEPQWLAIQQQSPQQFQRYMGWQFAQIMAHRNLADAKY